MMSKLDKPLALGYSNVRTMFEDCYGRLKRERELYPKRSMLELIKLAKICVQKHQIMLVIIPLN